MPASPSPITLKTDPLLRLLFVAPSDAAIAPLVDMLREVGLVPYWERLANVVDLRNALGRQGWDAVLCVPGINGLAPSTAQRNIRDLGLDLPFIVITPGLDEKQALRAMKSGAHDVIELNHLELLLPAIEREVREARQRNEHRVALEMLRESESRFRALASNLPGMVFQLRLEADGNFRFLYVSEGCHKILGLKQHELLASAQRFVDAVEAGDRKSLLSALAESAEHASMLNWEGRIRSRGKAKWVNLRSTPQVLDGNVVEWQGIVTNISHSKDIEVELRNSREQLAELSSHLEAAKEAERERIARDIHDELGSILVRLKIEASLLAGKLPGNDAATLTSNTAAPGTTRHGPEADVLKTKVRSIEALLDQAMSTAGRVARQLRPGILKEFGLSAAIESQAEDFAGSTGITCRTHCESFEDGEVDPDTSLAIFRVVQEALTNVAKHAHASLVVVRMQRENGSIALEIRDNGRGISDADMAKRKSFGLRGIRERVHALAGSFDIRPGEHGGTCLQLQIPLAGAADVGTTELEPIAPQGNLF
ncbi:MAG TPA: ATP-binding protein [Rhodocyclaceae bacterium]|nr:ATP-binding protein [Rhodocyclaceae bacterium]